MPCWHTTWAREKYASLENPNSKYNYSDEKIIVCVLYIRRESELLTFFQGMGKKKSMQFIDYEEGYLMRSMKRKKKKNPWIKGSLGKYFKRYRVMVVNFMHQLQWAIYMLILNTVFCLWILSLRVFPDEISIWIMDSVDCLSQYGRASFHPLRAWKEQNVKEGGGVPFFSASMIERGTP